MYDQYKVLICFWYFIFSIINGRILRIHQSRLQVRVSFKKYVTNIHFANVPKSQIIQRICALTKCSGVSNFNNLGL